MSEVTAQDVARVASSFARQELEVGARLERERIIKLLKVIRCGCGSTECPHIMDAIDLIEGENK